MHDFTDSSDIYDQGYCHMAYNPKPGMRTWVHNNDCYELPIGAVEEHLYPPMFITLVPLSDVQQAINGIAQGN